MNRFDILKGLTIQPPAKTLEEIEGLKLGNYIFYYLT